MKIVSKPGFFCATLSYSLNSTDSVQRSVKLGCTVTHTPREANVLGTICGGTGQCKIQKQVLSVVTGNV